MGEAELTGNPIEVGDSGMATALESFTSRIRGKDSSLEGRSIPEREKERALIGADLYIADTDRKVRELINTQEARTGFMRKKFAIVTEQTTVISSRGSSAAINLTPNVLEGIKELRVSSDSGKGIFTASEAESMAFSGRKIDGRLVHSSNVIVMLMHCGNTSLILSGARRKVTDNGTKVSHGVDFKGFSSDGAKDITVRGTDGFEKVFGGTCRERIGDVKVNGIEVDKRRDLGEIIGRRRGLPKDRVVIILFGNSLDKGSRGLASQRGPALTSDGKQWITGRRFPA
jgi:hypothetical protein